MEVAGANVVGRMQVLRLSVGIYHVPVPTWLSFLR